MDGKTERLLHNPGKLYFLEIMQKQGITFTDKIR